MRTTSILALAACAVVAVAALSTTASAIVSGQEFMLPMSDGVSLATKVTMLKSGQLPTLIDRSPYGWRLNALAELGLLFNYAALQQEFRGTYDSEGHFRIWGKAADDFYDTAAWVAAQPWSNGKVKAIGASADGIAASAAILRSPAQVDGMTLIFYSTSAYETIYPGGAFRKSLIEGWLNATVKTLGEAALDIAEVRASESPAAPLWAPLNFTGQYGRVDFPTVHWCGWYDIFQEGCLLAYEGMQHQASTPGQARIVIDPLGHCQKASKFFPDNLIKGRSLLPLFEFVNLMKYQADKPAENTDRATWYVMGAFNTTDAPGNYWTTADEFPQYVATPFYLTSDRQLALELPTGAPPVDVADSFVHDPANPVPTLGGDNLEIACGPQDQREVEEAALPGAVLTYTSAPLEADLYTCGPLRVRLFVATNATDTDFTAKLTHVYPDGTSRLLADGIVRMRWRMGPYFSNDPSPITPGATYQIEVNLWNISYAFPQGHQVRLSIAGANYPRFEVNPNNGLPINETGPIFVAQNTVFLASSETPSALLLPVVDKAQLPPVGVLELAERRRAMIERNTGEPLDMAAIFRASETMENDIQSWAKSMGML